MTTPTKISVTPAEASDLMAQGYTIECYLILPPANAKTPGTRASAVNPTDHLALSTGGTPPKKGGVSAAYTAMKVDLFKKDPRKTYTREALEAWFKEKKFKYPAEYVSQLIHKHKVLRVVEKSS